MEENIWERKFASPKQSNLAELELQEIAQDPQKLEQMLQGSDINFDPQHLEENFKRWEESRRYIVDAIDKDGKLLDYGCANGFLLKSLQAWSKNEIDPYGVDIEEDRLATARNLFKGKETHFFNAEGKDKKECDEWLNQQDRFDFIHWNVWDNKIEEYTNQEITDDSMIEKMVEALKPHLKSAGKIILSSYHADKKISSVFLGKLQQKWNGKVLESSDKENFSFIIG